MKNARYSKLAGSILRMAIFACLISIAGTDIAAANKEEPKASELKKQGNAAMEDGLYKLAQAKFEALMETSVTPAEKSEHALLLAGALYELEQYQEMLDILMQYREQASRQSWADAFDARLIFAKFGLREWKQVSAEAKEFEHKYTESTYIPYIIRLRALSLMELKKLEDALPLFARYAENHEDLPDWPANQLDFGSALAESGRDSEAVEALEHLLALNPENSIGDECRLRLGALYAKTGNMERARTIMEPLLTRKQLPDSMRTRAVSSMTSIAETQTNLVEAIQFLDVGLARITEPALKAEAKLRKGKLLLKMDRTDEGIALVREFVSSKLSTSRAGDIQLELAQILLTDGKAAKALLEYQNYLESFSDPAGTAKAYEGKGWAMSMLGRHDEAAVLFEQAAELSSDQHDQAICLFKSGECYFAAGRLKKAMDAYKTVIARYPETPLADQALFQIADALARQGETDKAESLFWEVYDKDHSGPLAGTALLNLAELKKHEQNLNDALSIYSILYGKGDDHLRAAGLYGIGDVHYKQGLFRRALLYFEEVVRYFPDSSVADISCYMCGWCFYMLGENDRAAEQFRKFVEMFPDSPWAPHAAFRAGEHEYNRGAYDAAEEGFMNFVRKYPESPMAETALFWAGRAALMQRDFRRANDYFALLIKDYPAGDKRGEARFFQGEALCEMGEFAAAILIFDDVIKMFPGSYLAEMAWFRKGDSQFTLGSDDPERYNEAIASYRNVLESPEVSDESRWQAEYKIGRCLEKLEQEEEAIEYYMKVVYSYLGSRSRNPRSNVWFTRSAFNAAALKEQHRNWTQAVNIYQRVVDADVPASRDAQERINRIRMEHWLFFY